MAHVKRKLATTKVDEDAFNYFLERPCNAFTEFTVGIDDWKRLRDDAIAEWVREHPGTRPAAWWVYDAPEPRRRLGGKGDSFGDAFPALRGSGLSRGIPSDWIPREGFLDAKGSPPDPDDPPLFESQAAYLKRHKLFLRGEARQLSARDFQPEKPEIEP